MTPRNKPTGEDPVILPRAHNGTEPQHLLLAMLGDYWSTRPEPLPSAALVELLGKFDVKESSARQAIRRLALKDHLIQVRDGRNTAYAFPTHSENVILSRVRHVVGFGRSVPNWDFCFTIVAFSIPEKRRDIRHELRTQLLSLGFGSLYDAVWISPHDKQADAVELLNDLGIDRGDVFYGPATGSRDAVTMVADAFDTTTLRQMYDSFIDDYEPVVRNLSTAADSLVTRTLMVNKWLILRTMDTNLPVEVLPADWPRTRAYEVFATLYDRLGARASAEVAAVIARYDPGLAKRAIYFTSESWTPTARSTPPGPDGGLGRPGTDCPSMDARRWTPSSRPG